MMFRVLQRVLRATATVTTLALVGVPAAASPYSAIYAFGDSLSDNGNLYALTIALGLPEPLPQPPYWNGRFSNGPAAVEVLADRLGLSNQLFDFAVGGALSGSGNGPLPFLPTGVRSQLNQYSASVNGITDPAALYFIWAGSNDFAYLGFSPATAGEVISNLTASVLQLYAMGARQFLLPLQPDFGLTPTGIALGPGTASALSAFSVAFNAALDSTYLQLKSALPGADFTIFDTLAAQRGLTQTAAAQGFNVTEGCFTGYVGVPGTVCADPSRYLYWDRQHPSAYFAAFLGNEMAAQVHEPATVLMVSVGLLLLAARRRGEG